MTVVAEDFKKNIMVDTYSLKEIFVSYNLLLLKLLYFYLLFIRIICKYSLSLYLSFVSIFLPSELNCVLNSDFQSVLFNVGIFCVQSNMNRHYKILKQNKKKTYPNLLTLSMWRLNSSVYCSPEKKIQEVNVSLKCSEKLTLKWFSERWNKRCTSFLADTLEVTNNLRNLTAHATSGSDTNNKDTGPNVIIPHANILCG